MKRIISNQPFPIGLLGNNCDTNNTQSVPNELLEYENIQNKPNLKLQLSSIKNRASRILQNEPNFTTNAPTKHANAANITQISYSLLQLCTRQLRTFAQKKQKIRNFCKYLKTTHLTPCKTKTYINISHQNTHLLIYSFTHLHKLCKTNPI